MKITSKFLVREKTTTYTCKAVNNSDEQELVDTKKALAQETQRTRTLYLVLTIILQPLGTEEPVLVLESVKQNEVSMK